MLASEWGSGLPTACKKEAPWTIFNRTSTQLRFEAIGNKVHEADFFTSGQETASPLSFTSLLLRP